MDAVAMGQDALAVGPSLGAAGTSCRHNPSHRPFHPTSSVHPAADGTLQTLLEPCAHPWLSSCLDHW